MTDRAIVEAGAPPRATGPTGEAAHPTSRTQPYVRIYPLTCECGSCATCKQRVYMRKYRARLTLEQVLATNRDRKRRSEYDPERERRWREANREKRRAHTELYRAVKKGLVIREPCSVCGGRRAEGHHTDYSQPLNVIWLCRLHHIRLQMGQA